MPTTNQKPDRRHITGISLDPSVHSYLDELAARMRTSRSWVLNTIVYEYAKIMEKKHLVPLAHSLQPPSEPGRTKEVFID